MRGNSGLIGAARSANSSSSIGIWSLIDQQVAKGSRNWPTIVAPANDYLTDDNAANLFLALPLTNYKSSVTGGFYVDVSPLIKTAQGITPGTAKTAAQTGNGSQSSAIASPFTQYTDNLLVNQQTSQANLFYYSTQLSNAVARTVEFWMYVPSGFAGSTLLATNNFGGGFYDGWNIYRDNSTGAVSYFTNNGGTQVLSGGDITVNTWHHVAYVFSGSGTSLQAYLNGTRVINTAYNSYSGRDQFTIGATDWDGIPNNNGLRFQDFRIYSVAKYTGASFTVNKDNANFGGRILT